MFHRYTLLALACLTALGLASEGAKANFSSSQSANTDSLLSRELSPTLLNPSTALKLENFLAAQALEPSSPSTAVEVGMLGPGSRGDEVKDLQRRLHNLGYYKANIDGTYGPETELAVSRFQQDVGLTETGFVDPATRQRIEISQLLPSSGSADSTSEQSPTAGEAASASPPTSPPEGSPLPSPAAEAPAGNAPNSSLPGNGEQSSPQPVLSPVLSQQPATSSPESSGWLLWFLLVGIGLLSFGTGLFFAKRSANKSLGLDHYDHTDRSTGLSDFDSAMAEGRTKFPNPNVAGDFERRNGLASAHSDTAQGIMPAHSMAVEGTTRLSRVNIIDELVGDLQSPDPAKRHKAVWELGQRGDSNAVQPLVDLIIDADSKERSLILAALSEIGIRVLKPMNRALAISLQDPNPEVRKNAIRDLTRIYDMAVQVSQMLTHAAEDPDPEVRETASWALEQMNRIRSIPDAETILSLRDAAKSGNLQEGADLTDLLPEEVHPSSEW